MVVGRQRDSHPDGYLKPTGLVEKVCSEQAHQHQHLAKLAKAYGIAHPHVCGQLSTPAREAIRVFNILVKCLQWRTGGVHPATLTGGCATPLAHKRGTANEPLQGHSYQARNLWARMGNIRHGS
jgi:hypothetical protein